MQRQSQWRPYAPCRQRYTTLQALAKVKIPDERKRNPGTVLVYEALDEVCILGWYINFERRCVRHGIYIPPPCCFTKLSYMGTEWEKDFCPHELYDKVSTMDTAIMSDLRFLCLKCPDLMHTLIASNYGYQTLKVIFVSRYCNVLKDDDIANQRLLDFKLGDLIPRRAQKVREYILENKILNAGFSKYQEFKLMINNFPPRHKDFLDIKATLLLNSYPRYDKDVNIPMELTIEQCATWIIQKFEEGGIPNPTSSQALKRSVAAIASNDLPLPSNNKEPSEELLKKCIDAMRKRECWGCKSPNHSLDQCPTHCITAKSNLVDRTKIVERSFPKRDQTFKKTNTKKVNFVANDDTIS